MSDRLNDLQRQRALILEQLAWLDREIAAAANPSAAPQSASAPAASPRKPASVAVDHEAEAIIAKFGSDPHDAIKTARKGCLVFFGLALLLLGLGLYGFYLYSRSRH